MSELSQLSVWYAVQNGVFSLFPGWIKAYSKKKKTEKCLTLNRAEHVVAQDYNLVSVLGSHTLHIITGGVAYRQDAKISGLDPRGGADCSSAERRRAAGQKM